MPLSFSVRPLPVPDGPVPRFARRAVLGITAAVGVVHLVASAVGGYWFDEVYMLAIGRYHLDWGSADQPPIAPLLAAAADALAPGSIVLLRLPAVLATAAAVLVAALIARELGGDGRAQAITAGAQASTLWITLAGHWLTPYSLEPVQWLVLCWLLVRWLRRRDDRLLLILGVVAGVAAETKFQVLLLGAVLLISVAVCGPRALLRAPMLWAGIAVGALLALPTLLWQAGNGWPQLRMGEVVAAEAEFLYGGRPGVAVGLVIMAGLAGTVLGAYGLVLLARSPEYRFLAVTALVLLIVFVAAPGRPYYLDGLYGLLAAAGAVGFQRRRSAGGRRRWLVWPAFALSVAAAGGMLALSFALVDSGVGEGIARRTADAYHALPPPEQARTAIIGESYIVAAYLDGYAPAYRLPPAYSGNRSYGYFPSPPESEDAVLYVGTAAPDRLSPYFTDVRPVADRRIRGVGVAADRPARAVGHPVAAPAHPHRRRRLRRTCPARPRLAHLVCTARTAGTRARWVWPPSGRRGELPAGDRLRPVVPGELAVGPAAQRVQRHRQPDQAGHGEHQGQAPVRADPEPRADPLGAGPGGHERDDHELGDRADQERGQRRGGLLDALREPEHPALPLERHHLLQHGLLGRLDERHQAEVEEHAHGQQQDRRAHREHGR